MKKLARKIYASESGLEDAISLIYSFVRFKDVKARIIVSTLFRFKNQGHLSIENGRIYIGFLSNRMFYQPSTRGVFRIYKGGKVMTHGLVRISKGCRIYVAGTLKIGHGTYVNPHTMIYASNLVSIGNNCAISWNCQILDSDFHQIEGRSFSKPIHIGNNVWIGCNVTILKGISIGDGAVIGANAIVSGDVPPYSIVAGNPARELRHDVKWRS